MPDRYVDAFDTSVDDIFLSGKGDTLHIDGCACGACAGSDDKIEGGGGAVFADTVPAGVFTTATVSPGSYVQGVIDDATDSDWFRITLVAGQHYRFSTILAADLSDSILRLRDSAGNIIATNDDAGGGNLFSEIGFTATTGGTYFLDVTGYNGDTGTFFLTSTAPVFDTIAASTATTASLTLGAAGTTGALDANGDHDWYAVNLVAGQTYLFTTSSTGGANIDTTLMLRNASGALAAYNDDVSNGNTLSRIRFTAATSGTYYLDLGAWGNAETGGYVVQAAIAPPLELYTNDQIANQLTNGYWGGTQRHWNVAPGGAIAVNITALTAPGQALAREAFALWADATGINFTEVTVGGQMTLDDNEAGAFASSTVAGGIITSARVNVSETWLTTYGATVRGYAFTAYVHEIGHALGLGHAGNYNTSATYSQDATYLNDSWATTIMSYFDQTENSYFANQNFSRAFPVTPLVADIIATTVLYGAASTTRTGDTIYGVGNTSGRSVYNADATTSPLAITIVDHGGVDTLDYSVYTQAQRINLNPETFSNIGSRIGNVTIARGTIIENATSGTGADFLTGNNAANRLDGGGGDDEITGGGGSDTLLGGGGADVAVFAGNREDYDIVTNGATTTVTGLGARAGDGADTLTAIETIRFANTTVSLGGNTNNPVQLGTEPVIDYQMDDGTEFAIVVPGAAFFDPDAGTVLTYTVTLANGLPLPSWLVFDPATQIFRGTAPESAIGAIFEIRVTASDQSSSASDNFFLTINEARGAEIIGTPGPDQLSGTFRAEGMSGEGGDDRIFGSAGADQMYGGDGTDFADYSASAAAISINLTSGFNQGGDAQNDILQDIEGITGSAFADTIVGDTNRNLLFGMAGADVIEGFGGADELHGGDGDDILAITAGSEGSIINGGAGTDTLRLDNSVDSIASVSSIERIDLVNGSNLTLTGGQFANSFASNIVINGSLGGTITVNMEAGILFISKLLTITNPDISFIVNGTVGTDIFKMGNVAHTINAGDGADQIKGGNAVDTINGGAGIDKINGAGGADILTGGAGNDVFKYANVSDSSNNGDSDHITDFTIGGDKLNFGKIDTNLSLAGDQGFAFIGSADFSANGAAQIRYFDNGADIMVQVDIDGDGSTDMDIILDGLAGQTMTAGDFVL
jgi:serralysin